MFRRQLRPIFRGTKMHGIHGIKKKLMLTLVDPRLWVMLVVFLHHLLQCGFFTEVVEQQSFELKTLFKFTSLVLSKQLRKW